MTGKLGADASSGLSVSPIHGNGRRGGGLNLQYSTDTLKIVFSLRQLAQWQVTGKTVYCTELHSLPWHSLPIHDYPIGETKIQTYSLYRSIHC
jgi:hypothetical protein